jgi:Xaa-Pro aminopeptidase
MEEFLHEELLRFARPKTTFEELYGYINGVIRDRGFVNLDFAGNLGHSIVKRKQDRVYIEKGNTMTLDEAEFFTFEPHIGIAGSKYGYKKENIYYFKDNKLEEL